MPFLAQIAETASPTGSAHAGGVVLHWLGVFHPVVVHFPIALLLLAALLEAVAALRGSSEKLTFSIRLTLGLGAVAALVAAGFGWADAFGMGFEAELKPILAWHRWLGTGVALGSCVAWVLQCRMMQTGQEVYLYRVVLWLVALATAVVGHLGGTLVYGLDYYP
ncbi:Uncharacterized membrane protein [Verrucomicrobium sp. GAS474]|uniref:DUF2231 domain-containing protein n=1 Tax=Verrucomicrobium sp. GAS474 TaxID=1882831 RepID=UPI00087B206F|nr:DUF2231 domain-containing protein [Verrucomicrobium sp. GAS474]SDT90857.1 Uncharacterized membrane protein [Verrucomicrobium sp. GAS474]